MLHEAIRKGRSCRNHGLGTSHGLDESHREPFVARRDQYRTCIPVVPPYLDLVAHLPMEYETFRDAQFLRQEL